ncbi:MAG: hypothetical protein GF331_20910 [Chitinivibrionales bacterium]|nr:hypothetical protein [Chitinivibrionales bacterium]
MHYDGTTSGGLRAHPHTQWLALVESPTATGFFQTGEYRAYAVYPEYGEVDPDNGAVIILYDAGDFVEMELCAPESTLAASDVSYLSTIGVRPRSRDRLR